MIRIDAALGGDRAAIRELVDAVTPVIEARVVRGFARRGGFSRGRDARQELEDTTQDVFAALFAHDGRVLRAWDPARGLSLANFVGLVADRHVATLMRSRSKNPWRDVPEELDTLEAEIEPVPDAAPRLESRRSLERLLDRLRGALSPRGLELFERLYVDEEPIEDVARVMGMTREAIYAWRNRVGKLVAKLAAEIDEAPPLDQDRDRRNPKGSEA